MYAHMQKDSVTVQVGDHVKRGQVLGKLGNTGNTSAPHLHFQLMAGPSALGAQGVPYLIDSFQLAGEVDKAQFDKILSYIEIGQQEGAKVLTGGERVRLGGDLADGYYVQPTIFEGENRMRIFQEEIFGPVVSVTRFTDLDDAVKIANDTLYGLGAGVWTRDLHAAYHLGRSIQAGRVWTNCYHLYPAHAAFGGYKQSGIGRENHKMMLEHYQQTKNLLVSYSPRKLGFF